MYDILLHLSPKYHKRCQVSASRWPMHEREIRGMLLQPVADNSQPIPVEEQLSCWNIPFPYDGFDRPSSYRVTLREVRVSTKDPKNFQVKALKSVTDSVVTVRNLVLLPAGMHDQGLHERRSSHRREIVGIETNYIMLIVSSPLESILCVLLPRQDVQPDGVH